MSFNPNPPPDFDSMLAGPDTVPIPLDEGRASRNAGLAALAPSSPRPTFLRFGSGGLWPALLLLVLLLCVGFMGYLAGRAS